MGLLMLFIALYGFGLAHARCTCQAVSLSTAISGADDPIVPAFVDYTLGECVRACCDYTGCVGFERLGTDDAMSRGYCALFRESVSVGGANKVFYTIGTTTSPTCEITNEIPGKVSTAFLLSSELSPSECKTDCCNNPNCQGYSIPLGTGVSSPQCILFSNVSSDVLVADSNRLLIDVSGCARQPETPQPLTCSRGDPSTNLGSGKAMVFTQPTPGILNSLSATDGIIDINVNQDNTAYDKGVLNLGTTRLIGLVTIIGTKSMVTAASNFNINLAYPSEGFIVRAGDCGDDIDLCPICAHVTKVTSNGIYEIDCRGIRGNYVNIYLPRNPEGAARVMSFFEIIVQPAPYIPPDSPGKYTLGPGSICCNASQAPVAITQWERTSSYELVTNTATDPFAPWIQASLGPVSVPVGKVIFAFPALSALARGLFNIGGSSSPFRRDTTHVGFRIGVSTESCIDSTQACPGQVCATIKRPSNTLTSASFVFTPGSQYTVDCQGRTGRFVWVQLEMRSGAYTNAPMLPFSSLQVFAPSRIAPAIYPARSDPSTTLLPTNALSIKGRIFSPSDVPFRYQQLELNDLFPVGIVRISSPCLMNLVRQLYLYATYDDDNPPIDCTFDDSPYGYYGRDQSAIVGVGVGTSPPCDVTNGCNGIICGTLNQIVDSSSFHVDCRGIPARYVYVMLPQPITYYLNNNGNNYPVREVSTPTQSPNGFDVEVFKMRNLLSANKVSEVPEWVYSAATTEFECSSGCFATPWCGEWQYNSSACVLRLQHQSLSMTPSLAAHVGGPACEYNNPNDNKQQPGPPFSPSWLTFPAQPYQINVPPTEQPTISPSTPPTTSPATPPTTSPGTSPTTSPGTSPTTSPGAPPTTITPTRSPTTKSPTTKQPTKSPTKSPTTGSPTTQAPTTGSPTTQAPTTGSPTPPSPTTKEPTLRPTRSPTLKPTTRSPSNRPTRTPTLNPTTRSPSNRPTTRVPTPHPTRKPTLNPTTRSPSNRPTTREPTPRPTRKPTLNPTTRSPSNRPTTREPTPRPTRKPTLNPTTRSPSNRPTTREPTLRPTRKPTLNPTTRSPSNRPTTREPTLRPTRKPTLNPTTRSPSTTKPSTGPPTSFDSATCSQLVRCYDCTKQGCHWVQSNTIMGCVPDCSSNPATCRTSSATCPELQDSGNFCAQRCGQPRTSCSCSEGCSSGCCSDFSFACPP